MMDLDEIAEDAKKVGGDTSTVLLLANQWLDKSIELMQLEEKAKALSKEIQILRTETIPEAMDAIGMSEFALADGTKIEIKPLIKGSLPSKGAIEKAGDEDRPLLEKRLADGLTYLRSNNAGSLIKNTLTFDIDKGKDNIVSQLEALGEELGLAYERDESVHAQTLNKWLKERIEEGKIDDIPQDTFAIFNGREAVVAKDKKPKKKV